MNRQNVVINALGDQLTFVEDELQSLGLFPGQLNLSLGDQEIRVAERILSLLVAANLDPATDATLRVVQFDQVVRIFTQVLQQSSVKCPV